MRPLSITDHSTHWLLLVCVSGARVAAVHHDTGGLPAGVRRDDAGAAVPDARQGPVEHPGNMSDFTTETRWPTGESMAPRSTS